MPYTDADKHREVNLASYHRRMQDPEQAKRIRAQRVKNVTTARRRKVEYIREFKLARGCADCGYNGHPAALDFDHVRGEKVGGIAVLVARSWVVLLAELEKCDVVCANCHRIRTAIERDAHPDTFFAKRGVADAG